MSEQKQKLSIALLGSGIFAREQHLPAILECADTVQLKAIYSRSIASAEKLTAAAKEAGLQDVEAYASESKDHDLEALLRREDIDAVIICLPIPVQPSIIRACLGAGKHVLSEKPIAPTLSAARELLLFSQRPETPAFLATTAHTHVTSALWAVAENYRFQGAWGYARTRIEGLGRILNFNVRVASMVEPETNKYFATSWRKTPSFPGGFIMDGGVHQVAGLRMLLGEDEVIERVSAFSRCNQEHLPPVDTVNAIMRTKAGTVGTFSLGFGTTDNCYEFSVACERGVVVVGGGGKVTVRPSEKGAQEEVKTISGNSSVKEELMAFAKGVLKGEIDGRQTPEEAWRDLELIEKMLQSGEKNGETMEVTGKME
ncbi:hypothetical protein BZA05DRAFT_410471 [Tricharina praecox]|uniref:uncharacterized protein n=1 Tax=Tricharina praecox TaxID=43433 RepID=UPI0022205AA0|nr:uncharacterized protein BZA05DRAFT_410471 [Tricharina praecox]KAI5843728.1 hypothetical protein BZA05DRAFT_410471 [Tricharina praecox]